MKLIDQSLSAESDEALFRLEPDGRFRPRCGACGAPARSVHSRSRKFVRDLNLADRQVLLQVEHRKVYCDTCHGVRVEELDFVDTSKRVTRRLAAYAAELCRVGLPVTTVAEHLDLSPNTVKDIEQAALEAEFGTPDYAGLKRLAIDEIAIRKRHSYMTIIMDYDTGRVVWTGEGRSRETIDGFFSELEEEVRAGIEAVAIDMWEPYIGAVKQWCPQADIVFDLFHVVQSFGKVIDKIRNEEYRKASAEGKDVLKGTKYLLLSRGSLLDKEQRVHLEAVLELNARLNTVYYLKDLLPRMWSYRSRGWAKKALKEWCSLAREDGHPLLVKFAEMLERHAYGIMNHCDHPISTARLEGTNNKIKVIKRIAFGFHDVIYFGLKIMQACPGDESCN